MEILLKLSNEISYSDFKEALALRIKSLLADGVSLLSACKTAHRHFEAELGTDVYEEFMTLVDAELAE